MKQLEIENMNTGILPDGTEIKEGDIIMYDYGPYSGQLTRAVLHGGKLCFESHFMYGDHAPIDHVLNQPTYSSIKKMSLVEVYKYCKANHWDTGKWVRKFSQHAA
jgi:hypothetical protein